MLSDLVEMRAAGSLVYPAGGCAGSVDVADVAAADLFGLCLAGDTDMVGFDKANCWPAAGVVGIRSSAGGHVVRSQERTASQLHSMVRREEDCGHEHSQFCCAFMLLAPALGWVSWGRVVLFRRPHAARSRSFH